MISRLRDTTCTRSAKIGNAPNDPKLNLNTLQLKVFYIHQILTKGPNQGIPFQYKKAVLDACFVSSILYSGEAWLGGQLKPLEILYNRAIKCLLGVRATTCTDLCFAELGYPTLSAMLDQRRSDFMRHFATYSDKGDALNLALEMCRLANTKAYRTLIKSRDSASNAVTESRSALRQMVVEKSASSSKRAQIHHYQPRRRCPPCVYAA